MEEFSGMRRAVPAKRTAKAKNEGDFEEVRRHASRRCTGMEPLIHPISGLTSSLLSDHQNQHHRHPQLFMPRSLYSTKNSQPYVNEQITYLGMIDLNVHTIC